jgi:sterol 3beta-glucosyltransferase
MNIVIMTFGSRGDIQPFVALAVALRERGHTVKLAVPGEAEDQLKAYSVEPILMPFSMKNVLETNSGKNILNEGITPLTLLAIWREIIPTLKRAMEKTAHLVTEAARDADLLIVHGFLIPFAHSIHQHLQIPLMLGIAAPIIATREFPLFPPIPFGQRFYNPFTFHLVTRLVTSFMIEPMNAYRRYVGLPKLSGGEVVRLLMSGQYPVVMHYSRHVQPPPADWSPNVHVVGAWRLPAQSDWTPPADLTAFLEQGEPPVFIGFGSMPVSNPPRTAQRISEGLRLANARGVLQAGWAGLEYQDEHLITIGDTPHDWLFPRMAAIVHHGGSGTTHSALTAGKPALIVPFSGDQPFWARRLVELGVAVPPIAPKRLTAPRLATALRTLTQDSMMRQRAAEMGALLRAEDGLAATCELVEQYGKSS